MSCLTPREIVEKLDQYIIGQDKAKRAVAIALRNRYRRSLLDPEMQAEITPKNIIMVGPTGVGKTEIARRLSKLMDAPFVKVEATKFTEVGYVGRDVESMIRDLVEASIRMVKASRIDAVKERAAQNAEQRLCRGGRPFCAEQELENADLMDGRHAGDHHVHRDEHHTAHRQHSAQEEDEIHHRFQPVGGGAGQPYPAQRRGCIFHNAIL